MLAESAFVIRYCFFCFFWKTNEEPWGSERLRVETGRLRLWGEGSWAMEGTGHFFF